MAAAPCTPEDICRVFADAMARGDLAGVLDVYDHDAVFVAASGDVTTSRDELRDAVAPLVIARTRFDYDVKQVAIADDVALMHTEWTVGGRKVYAIEVARRQADGAWKWLIGDPHSVERHRAR